jgi:glyoxylase-like metal-dependent hydrolase (beta-lactamase superfamily II)
VLLFETFPVGPLECNCSIIGCPDTKEAIVVDPGGDADRIEEVLRHYDLSVRYIIHTHAHFDHMGATRDVKERAGEAALAPAIAVHDADKFLYDGYLIQAKMFRVEARPTLPVDHWLVDGESLPFGKLSTKVLHTPGHTPGSCCFHLEIDGRSLLLSGDTLFAGGIGRTDLPGGDYPTLEKSIRSRLYSLDGDTLVIPGHGPATKIGDEARNNAFVRA